MSDMTLDEVEAHRRDLARAEMRGMSLGEFRSWRASLRADYKRMQSPGRIAATVLAVGALFFLLDPDARLGVTMCSRAMTDEEWAEYCKMPAANRRRKPDENVDDDEERARKRRVASLMGEIASDAR